MQLQAAVPAVRIASFRMYLSATFALFSAMSIGCVIGWSGIALENLKKPSSSPRLRTYSNGTVVDNDLLVETWISSTAMSAGALLGSLLASFIIYYAGRCKTLIALGIPMITGWACICYAPNLTWIVIGRALTGFCTGLICVATPSYVLDISTPARKGFLGTGFQIMLCIGELYEACFASMLDWNQLAYVAIVPTILCSFGMLFFASNSPISDLINGDCVKARRTLTLLRAGNSDIDEELKELQNRVQTSQLYYKQSILRCSVLKRPDVYRPALICVALMVFQQFSGINTFMFYLKNIFEGIDLNINSNFAIVILNGVHAGATIHAALIIDKFGRKMLLIISGIGTVVSLGLMGFYYRYIHPEDSWIPVACLMLFVVMYSLGLSPIPWMIAGELVPHEALPLVSSFVSITNWVSVLLITHYFEPLTQLIHKYGAYWLFTGFSALSVLFTVIFVPETNGRSIEDMQKFFTK